MATPICCVFLPFNTPPDIVNTNSALIVVMMATMAEKAQDGSGDLMIMKDWNPGFCVDQRRRAPLFSLPFTSRPIPLTPTVH